MAMAAEFKIDQSHFMPMPTCFSAIFRTPLIAPRLSPLPFMTTANPLGTLARLPREVRDIIFTHAVARECWKGDQIGSACIRTGWYMSPPAITRVSRQIREETLRLFYASNTWSASLGLSSHGFCGQPLEDKTLYFGYGLHIDVEFTGYRTLPSGIRQPLKPFGLKSKLFTSFLLDLNDPNDPTTMYQLEINVNQGLPSVKHPRDICVVCCPAVMSGLQECDEIARTEPTRLTAEYQRLRIEHDENIAALECALFSYVWDPNRPKFSLANLEDMVSNLRGSVLQMFLDQARSVRELGHYYRFLCPLKKGKETEATKALDLALHS